MTSVTDDLRLAADFPAAGEADWRKLVDGVLKGAPFEKLVGKTYDGLKIAPIYPRAKGAGLVAGRALGRLGIGAELLSIDDEGVALIRLANGHGHAGVQADVEQAVADAVPETTGVRIAPREAQDKGIAGTQEPPALPRAIAPVPTEVERDGTPARFYIDPDGFAMADGRPMTTGDLPAGATLWDDEDQFDDFLRNIYDRRREGISS